MTIPAPGPNGPADHVWRFTTRGKTVYLPQLQQSGNTRPVLNDPAAFQKFQQVQGELSSALSRLMAVSENYPNLKADTSFRDLQSQLEGTENRITVARQRYIAAVQDFNVQVRKFPTNLTAMMFGYEVKPSFTVENEKAISTAPAVNFGK